MLHKISLRFWLRRNQKTRDNLIPIYLRIQIEGTKTAEISTGIAVHPLQWNSKSQCLKGRNDISKLQNIQLLKIKSDILNNFITLQASNKALTATDVKNGFIILDNKFELISAALDAFMQHEENIFNTTVKMKPATFHNKKNFALIVKEYIGSNLDHRIDTINQRWVKNFFDWMLNDKKYKPSYVCNVRVFVKEFTKFLFNKKYLNDDPLHKINYTIKRVKNEIVYSDLEEINKIKNHEWDNEKLIQSVDLYTFSCYTGLCYSDAMNFNYETDITIDNENNKWLNMERLKSSVEFTTPLLAPAEMILNKYKNKLPCLTLSAYNKSLKKISIELNLNKILTSHKARKSFGMLVTDEYNLPIEAAALMMGHTNTRTTETHYIKKNRRKQSKEFGKELNRLVRT